MEIEGLAAVVTGAASGLGAATAAILSAAGANVTILDRDRAAGEAHAQAIGGRFVEADVTDADGIEAALIEAEASFGVARILVNCAGIAPAIKTVGRDGVAHKLVDFRRAVEINLVGTFNVLSQFAARLIPAEPVGEERGVIINTASVAAYDGQMGQAAYGASKSGVVGLTLPVARDLAREKIRVMTIAPGIFMTPMMKGLPQAAQDSLGQQVPHPSRLGQPEEYAKLVQAIITNPMLNGEVIRLDGAIRMGPR
ncbi:3-hydroxyacyl-CoA dehydrogenase [Sphingobium sp. ba1]|uniref:SDR family NAD(P)-dependent oxidoreductase n=1 Tax=Sphingobium sp. ba1 TaxID=1522072 RepID=UPI000504A552|nr:SDR family NAD(P)-dependent oxidoreductase [Sphingobium sp. ba1]KFL44852.1 3-hydroxyacyl-CoA dehydrogenase [Sphingobium sp. ba1]